MATWSLRERPVCSLPATGPIAPRERHLEVEVDVLERRVPGDRAGDDVRPDRVQAGDDRPRPRAAVSRPASPSARAWAMEPGEVVERELDVDVDRPPEGERQRIRLAAEPRAPGLHAR